MPNEVIMELRNVFPVKHYVDKGFVENKIEITEEHLQEIIDYYITMHADFDYDEIRIVNNRPMNVYLHAICRKYVDPNEPDVEVDADFIIEGDYDDNPDDD